MSGRLVAGLVASVALLGAATLLAVLFVGGKDDAGPEVGRLGQIALDGVSLDELADGHQIMLSPPAADYSPQVNATEAERAPSNWDRGVAAKQVLLARLQTPTLGGIDEEVWIINYDPDDPHRAGLCPGNRGIYEVSFVDADSGEVLFTSSKDDPPPDCGGPFRGQLTSLLGS